MTALLIGHGLILLPDSKFLLGNILIQQGTIVHIPLEITASHTVIIDGTALTLLPGLSKPEEDLLTTRD